MAPVTTVYDFEGPGAADNTAASNTSAGVALVVQAAGATVRHQVAAALGGSAYGLEIVSGTTGASYVEVTSFPNDDQIVIWFPYKLPTASMSGTPSILQCYGGSAGTTTVFRLQMGANDVVQFQDVASAHTVLGPDLTDYLGTWVVFQIVINVGTSSSTGEARLRVYSGANRAAGDFIGAEASSTILNLGGSTTAYPVVKVRCGVNTTQTASRTIQMDKLKIVSDSQTWINGLTTTVTPATLTANWEVKGYATNTLALSWQVRTAMAAAKTLALSWNVRTNTAPATLTANWLVRANITPSTLPLTWTQRAYVTQVLAAAWQVRAMMAAPSTLAMTWQILAEGDNTFRLVGLSGATGQSGVSSTFRLVGLSGSVNEAITVEILGPDFVDVFQTFEMTVITSSPVASYTWQQFDGPLAEVESAGETWRGEAPADEERLTLKFRVTVDPGSVTAEHTVTVHKAAFFTLQPNGEWVPSRFWGSSITGTPVKDLTIYRGGDSLADPSTTIYGGGISGFSDLVIYGGSA